MVFRRPSGPRKFDITRSSMVPTVVACSAWGGPVPITAWSVGRTFVLRIRQRLARLDQRGPERSPPGGEGTLVRGVLLLPLRCLDPDRAPGLAGGVERGARQVVRRGPH